MGLIASTVKRSGIYDYKVVELTEKNCILDFFQGKEFIGRSAFSIEDAKKALTQNLDKFPKNMLFARAMSNGAKWFCPDVFAGPIYTPEEMGGEDITMDVTHEVVEDIPVLTDKQFEKLLKSPVDVVTKHLEAISEGRLKATQVQVLNLESINYGVE